jgi:hypothetical protein
LSPESFVPNYLLFYTGDGNQLIRWSLKKNSIYCLRGCTLLILSLYVVQSKFTVLFFSLKYTEKYESSLEICSVHNFFWIQSSKNFLVLKGFYFLYIFRELNEKFVEAGFPPIQHTYDVWHLCKVNICYMLDTILLAILC